MSKLLKENPLYHAYAEKCIDCHYWDFDEESRTLIIHEVTPSLFSDLKTERYTSVQKRYMKEEYIFTSASSGAFTVGGFNKIGGYKDEKVRTDKYTFKYAPNYSDGKPIKRIVLSDELYRKAYFEDSLRYYLRNGYIEIEKDEIKPDDWLLSNSSVTVRSILEEQAIIDTLPTKEQCDTIINWLRNTIPNINITQQNSQISNSKPHKTSVWNKIGNFFNKSNDKIVTDNVEQSITTYNNETKQKEPDTVTVVENTAPDYEKICMYKTATPRDYHADIMKRNPKLKIVDVTTYDFKYPTGLYDIIDIQPDVFSIDPSEITFGFVCEECKTCYIGEWMLPIVKYNPEEDSRHPSNNEYFPDYTSTQNYQEYLNTEKMYQAFLSDLDDNMSVIMKNINKILHSEKCSNCSNTSVLNKNNSFVMLYTDSVNQDDKYFKPFFESGAEILDLNEYIDNYDIGLEKIIERKISSY